MTTLIYILKRIGIMVVTLWFIMTITFTAMFFMPGKPYPNIDHMTEADIERQDEYYGFNRPFAEQYIDYFAGVLGFSGYSVTEYETDTGNDSGFFMGYSFTETSDVNDVITRRYPVSFQLGITSLVFGTLVGITLGLVASIKKNTGWDYFTTFIAVIGVSFPSFVLATYNQYIFSVLLGFPSMYSKGDVISMILPVLSLSVFAISQVARVTRTEMIEVLGSNYITLAKAKGVSNAKVTYKHALRNILVSIITILGPLMVGLTTGSLVIETIFSIPGIGQTLTASVTGNDIFLVLGTTLVISIQILAVYLIVDVLYVFIDPRIKLHGGK